MNLSKRLKRALPWLRPEREQDLDREIQNHLDLEAEESGRDAAQRAFGNTLLVKEDIRRTWGWVPLEEFVRDIRFAFRQLRKSPGFSAVAILTLALGIGANTAMFSVVDAVLIRPLPYRDADRLAMVWEDASSIGFPRNVVSPWNWQEWRRRSAVFSDIAATEKSTAYLIGDGEPERLDGRGVSANFWTALGTPPLVGRVFTEQEDRRGARVAVISYGLWQRRFAGAREIAGREIGLNGTTYTVIGVMPNGFYFLPSRDVDIWLPAAFSPQELSDRGSHYLDCVARLKPGVTIEQARQAMTAIGKRMLAEDPDHQSAPVVVSLREQLAGNTRTSLVVLLAASLAILLISCANLANLLLARGAERGREVAVRQALGAGLARLMRQFLTEGLVLAMLGAIAGLVLARPAMQVLETLVPPTMAAVHLTLDWRVLVYSTAIAAFAGIAFGLAPAFSGSRLSRKGALHVSLKEGGRGTAGSRRHWFQNSLIVAETALAVMLLTGGGLLLQTLHHLHQRDLGIRTEKLLTMVTPIGRFRDFNRRVAFTNAILEKIRAVPGVVNAGAISDLPLTNIGNSMAYQFAGQTNDKDQNALNRVVTLDYFATIGAHLREGRFFQESDRAPAAQPVVMVNETFADRHFRGRSALGARFQFGRYGADRYWFTIVGVVKEIRERGVTEELKPAVYVLNERSDQSWAQTTDLVIRTSIAPESIAPSVRQAIWSLDRNQPIAKVRTLDDVVAAQLAEPSQDSALLAAFAAIALALACIGLYGLLSYTVTQRTQEIGVRMALGATSGGILVAFARRGLALTVGGLSLGLLLAMAASRLMTALLYGFQPDYAPTVAAVAGILLIVAAIASFVPVRRASRVDPIVALRHE
jgi:putative ABC transport system permease protein